MSEKGKISRATGILGAATTLSRVAGLVRDMLIATLFGAGFGTDAFFMAFTIPNLLRRFFAEGAMTAAFVPTFSAVYHQQGRQEAQRLLNICWTLLLIVMLVVTLCGVVGSPLIVRGIGFGYAGVEGKLALTDLLNRIMFPYIFFVSLLALVTGVLNVLGHYFVPAVSTVLLNVAMIVTALLGYSYFEVPITALALGVLIGGVLQFVIQIPVLHRHGMRLHVDGNFTDPMVRRIARLMLPGIAGVAIYQINVIVTRLLASFLPEGSVSYLYYGQRLFEFPQGIFVVSLAQAVLPTLSRQVSENDTVGVRESLRFALALILVVTVPAALGLMLCATPIYSLFFMSGAFDIEAVHQTSMALIAYAPGLLFVGMSRVIVPLFYARQDTRTPVWISFWTLLVNAGLGLLLMGPLGHLGLAWALTLSAFFNALLLMLVAWRRFGVFELQGLLWTALKMLPALALMALVVTQILQMGSWEVMSGRVEKGVLLAASVVAGGGTYLLLCLLLRIPEATYFAHRLKLRLMRRGGGA
ncbi:MAG: murein biosynthesis integral membrane protein MurJ [Desulfuromonas sp.]|nr:MAG: murein biosynthesis integral membrane protein MurJ [Desulfuromonas sp.]